MSSRCERAQSDQPLCKTFNVVWPVLQRLICEQESLKSMSKKRKTRYRDYVMHPRYGCKPRYSGSQLTAESAASAHWSFDSASVFPETAISADASQQNFTLCPRRLYVDVERQCMQCDRWFIFFAEEQKYWFEVLKFYVDADCTKCIDCRKAEQQVRLMLKRYQTLSA